MRIDKDAYTGLYGGRVCRPPRHERRETNTKRKEKPIETTFQTVRRVRNVSRKPSFGKNGFRSASAFEPDNRMDSAARKHRKCRDRPRFVCCAIRNVQRVVFLVIVAARTLVERSDTFVVATAAVTFRYNRRRSARARTHTHTHTTYARASSRRRPSSAQRRNIYLSPR